jgi:trehalose-6-phosphatase
VEDKEVQLTFHYRSVPEEERKEMVTKAEEIILRSGFKVKQG